MPSDGDTLQMPQPDQLRRLSQIDTKLLLGLVFLKLGLILSGCGGDQGVKADTSSTPEYTISEYCPVGMEGFLIIEDTTIEEECEKLLPNIPQELRESLEYKTAMDQCTISAILVPGGEGNPVDKMQSVEEVTLIEGMKLCIANQDITNQ